MARLLLLLPLPVIAFWVVYSGVTYQGETVKLASLSSSSPLLSAPELTGLERRERPIVYTKDNLYEYVNGHAEFFISAGFEKLTVYQYSSEKGAGELTLEIYDMGSPENALGTLSQEKGSARSVQDIGRKAYAAPGLLLFYKGRYYVKASGFHLEEETLLKAGEEVAGNIESGESGGGGSLLPGKNMIPDSRGFVKSNYLALSFLENVRTAVYELDGEKAEGFAFSSPPDRLLEFFDQEGAEIIRRDIAEFQGYLITSRYEGSLGLVTDGESTVGLKGEVADPLLKEYLGQAAAELRE